MQKLYIQKTVNETFTVYLTPEAQKANEFKLTSVTIFTIDYHVLWRSLQYLTEVFSRMDKISAFPKTKKKENKQ